MARSLTGRPPGHAGSSVTNGNGVAGEARATSCGSEGAGGGVDAAGSALKASFSARDVVPAPVAPLGRPGEEVV